MTIKSTKTIKHDFFSKSNIKKYPERMVIIGFIAADGCITKWQTGQKHLIFNISEKDKIALEIINNTIADGNRSINYLKNTKSCMLSIPSDEICNDLKRYNIVERKSDIYDLPLNLTKKQMQYFLKGYFYGDGCITTKPQYPINGISIVGSNIFIDNIQQYLNNNKIIENCPLYNLKSPKIKQLTTVGRMASKFSKYLFFDNKFNLLPRKTIIFEDETFNTKLTINDIRLIKYETDINKIVKLTGRSIASIKNFKYQMDNNCIRSKHIKIKYENI